MNWLVFTLSFISVIVGSQLVRHDEPTWGGALLGLAIVLARLSGMMQENKRNN